MPTDEDEFTCSIAPVFLVAGLIAWHFGLATTWRPHVRLVI
jgi:hypothetical protein